jgi:DNA-binding IscR family transcriptional regulator
VAEALNVLGGRLFDANFCNHFAGDGDNCTHSLAACTVRALWGQVQEAVDQVLAKTTLGDLLRQGHDLTQKDNLLGISS